MNRHRAVFVAAALLLLGASTAVNSAAEPVPAPTLSGTVQDTIGNLLDGVEILLVRPGATADPLATTRSDAGGRFAFAGLAPGAYRIAVLKDGYGAFVATVDTHVQRVLSVVLQPVVAGPDGSAYETIAPEWVLRLPRRSVLREDDAPALARFEVAAAPEANLPDALALSLEQTFRASTGGRDGGRDDGAATRVELSSPIGNRASVRLSGFSERVADGSAADRDDGDSGVAVGIDYRPAHHTELQVHAFYAHAGLTAFGAAPAEAPLRSWGYDARWSRQFDPTSRLDVSLDYVGTRGVALDGGGPPARTDADVGNVGHSVRAAGAFERQSGPSALRVLFHARALETPPGLVYGTATPALFGVEGWSLGLDAEETRSFGGPVSLVYGVGYKRALTRDDAALFTPRVGGHWQHGRLGFRGVLSYHGVAGGVAAAEDASFAPDGRLGWAVDVEAPIASTWTVHAGSGFEPSRLDRFGYDGGLEGPPDPLFLTDGNVAVTESRFAVVHDAPGLRAILELEQGRADGAVAAWLPDELPTRRLADRALRYRSGQVGLHLAPSGTGIRFDYRRTDERAARAGAPGLALARQAFELQVRQRLTETVGGGDWRLLVAYRMARLSSGEPDDGEVDELAALEGDHRRVSAGLSVRF